VIEKWCRATGIKPSKMMIPLSYACIFGGTCTIVGTSTNLIVVGLVAGLDPTLRFPFFEVRCSLDLSFSAADLITHTHALDPLPDRICGLADRAGGPRLHAPHLTIPAT
jgi:hypothetical protein